MLTFPTVETILEAALAETLGSAGQLPTSLQDTALIRETDRINRTFVQLGDTLSTSKGWDWMQAVTHFNTVSSTSLNGAISSGDTTVILTSASDFDTSGRIVIRTSKNTDDIVDYTGKSTNTLSGVTGVDLDHTDGSSVEKAYPLPSNFGRAHQLFIDSSEYLYTRARSLPIGRGYTIFEDYILLPENTGPHEATLEYQKSPTDLYGDSSTNTTDKAKSLDIPEAYIRYPIELLKAYIHRVNGKPELAANSLQFSQEALEAALSFDTNPTSNHGVFTAW